MNINYMLSLANPKHYDKLYPISERVVPLEFPEIEQGNFTLTKRKFETEFRFEMSNHGGYVRYDGEVIITMLRENGVLWMSDSPSELRDMNNLVSDANASGRVLVAGLGMGLLVAILLDVPEVREIVVVEKSEEVIMLIQPFLEEKDTDKKLKFINEDIMQFVERDPLAFDSCILDIWGDISSDDLDGMLLLWTKIQKKQKMDGAIWGLSLVTEDILQTTRGYEKPSDFAYELESQFGLGGVCEHILEYYPDEDYEEYDEDEDEYYSEWDGLEDEVMAEAFLEIYGLHV